MILICTNEICRCVCVCTCTYVMCVLKLACVCVCVYTLNFSGNKYLDPLKKALSNFLPHGHSSASLLKNNTQYCQQHRGTLG